MRMIVMSSTSPSRASNQAWRGSQSNRCRRSSSTASGESMGSLATVDVAQRSKVTASWPDWNGIDSDRIQTPRIFARP